MFPGALTLTFFLAATAVWASGTEHCGPALWTAYYVFLVYVAVAAGLRRQVLGRPTVLRRIERSLGVVLVGFAARLAVADR